jgi:adenylate cyclase
MIDRAVELNPNFAHAWAHSGWINLWLGHPDIALEHLGRAQRLDPVQLAADSTLSATAHALFFLDRHEEAMTVAEQILRHSPNQHPGLRIGAASAALAGHSDVAHRLAAHLRSIDPAFAISKLRKQLGPYQKAEFVEKYTQALRLAGSAGMSERRCAATLLAADAGYASLTFAQRATNRRPVSPLQVSGARLPFADA